MALSKAALLCLESSSYFKLDILNAEQGKHKVNKKRYRYGEFRNLYKEYRKHSDKFYEYTRMSVETFDYILQHIEVHLQHHVISRRVVTNPEKLFLTLRYLAHGPSFMTLAHSYRRGRSTVAKTIYQTLKALWKTFSQLHMPLPTQEHLRNISVEFFTKWQFPNCIGSIDGKHFRIMKPHGDSEYYKYKKYYSLVLQAIADADYKFIAIEVGGKGCQSDAFHFSKLNESLTNNRFNVPPPKNLPGSNVVLPHVVVGNEAYPLGTYLMRPYPSGNLNREKKIFNERLTRARVTIEYAYGIMSHKWRIFMKSIETNPKHAKLIIEVACVLHNIVRQKEGNSDKDFREYMNNYSKSNNKPTRSRRNNRASLQAVVVRDQYRNYFVNNPITNQ